MMDISLLLSVQVVGNGGQLGLLATTALGQALQSSMVARAAAWRALMGRGSRRWDGRRTYNCLGA